MLCRTTTQGAGSSGSSGHTYGIFSPRAALVPRLRSRLRPSKLARPSGSTAPVGSCIRTVAGSGGGPWEEPKLVAPVARPVPDRRNAAEARDAGEFMPAIRQTGRLWPWLRSAPARRLCTLPSPLALVPWRGHAARGLRRHRHRAREIGDETRDSWLQNWGISSLPQLLDDVGS